MLIDFLATAATVADPRMRTFGTYVLAVSFLLRAGTSNDLVGQRIMILLIPTASCRLARSCFM
jgi:hypothetical protein